MRKHLVHGLAGMSVGGERRDLGVRMPRQQTHRVGPGVAGRAENADLLFRAHRTVPSRIGSTFNRVVWVSNNCGRSIRISSDTARGAACGWWASALATRA